jgi:hypothetical protein
MMHQTATGRSLPRKGRGEGASPYAWDNEVRLRLFGKALREAGWSVTLLTSQPNDRSPAISSDREGSIRCVPDPGILDQNISSLLALSSTLPPHGKRSRIEDKASGKKLQP